MIDSDLQRVPRGVSRRSALYMLIAFSVLVAQRPSAARAQEPLIDVLPVANNLTIFNNAQASSPEIEEVARAARFSLAYFQQLGVELPPASIVLVKGESRTLVDGDRMVLNLDNSDWLGRDGLTHDKVMTHESGHLLQNGLAGTTQASFYSPRWLLEGTAELLSEDALIRNGRTTAEEVKKQRVANFLIFENILPDLQTLEKPEWFGGQLYDLCSLATHSLIGARGIESLLNFYRSLKGKEGSWSEEFDNAFGVYPGTFYNDFKKIRQDRKF